MRSLTCRARTRALWIAASLACGLTGQACATHAAPETGTSERGFDASVVFDTDGAETRVRVEVADEPHELSMGLMFRRELAPDAGMIFIFPDEREHSFWMKNTYIPLDMVFIDASRRVVGVVANTAPMTTDGRSVGKPSLYVVEVAAGYAKDHGIVAGTSMTLRLAP